MAEFVDQHLQGRAVEVPGVPRIERHVALHDHAIPVPDVGVGGPVAERVHANGVDVVAFRVEFAAHAGDGPLDVRTRRRRPDGERPPGERDHVLGSREGRVVLFPASILPGLRPPGRVGDHEVQRPSRPPDRRVPAGGVRRDRQRCVVHGSPEEPVAEGVATRNEHHGERRQDPHGDGPRAANGGSRGRGYRWHDELGDAGILTRGGTPASRAASRPQAAKPYVAIPLAFTPRTAEARRHGVAMLAACAESRHREPGPAGLPPSPC